VYNTHTTSFTQKHVSMSCSLWIIFIASGVSLPDDDTDPVSGLAYSSCKQIRQEAKVTSGVSSFSHSWDMLGDPKVKTRSRNPTRPPMTYFCTALVRALNPLWAQTTSSLQLQPFLRYVVSPQRAKYSPTLHHLAGGSGPRLWAPRVFIPEDLDVFSRCCTVKPSWATW